MLRDAADLILFVTSSISEMLHREPGFWKYFTNLVPSCARFANLLTVGSMSLKTCALDSQGNIRLLQVDNFAGSIVGYSFLGIDGTSAAVVVAAV